MGLADFARRVLVPEDESIELQASEPAHIEELGSTGMTRYGQLGMPEYNQELVGRRGVRVYDKMRRGDAQIRGTLRLVKTPITAAQWYIDPAGDSDLDYELAEFVDWALHNMDRTFESFIWETLFLLDYGYYVFEKVFDTGTWKPIVSDQHLRPRERPVVRWSKLAPRHPGLVNWWEFDDSGEPVALNYQRVSARQGTTVMADNVLIPRRKLLVFTLDEESRNPEGMSVLRSAYKHWYYKENLYKVDAIQKERHGIGIPIIHLPPGFTDEDKRQANEMGANLRTNEKAHVVLPPGWNIEMLAMNTNLVDVLRSAEHHDLQIARNVLGQFLNIVGTAGGSRASGGEQIQLFMKALKYIADLIRAEINQNAIPELVDFNYPNVTHYPQLKVRSIGETADFRAWSAAVLNMVNSGMLTPDAETEEWVREQLDFPQGRKETLDRSPEERLAAGKMPTRAPNPNADTSAEQQARQGQRPDESGTNLPSEGRAT